MTKTASIFELLQKLWVLAKYNGTDIKEINEEKIKTESKKKIKFEFGWINKWFISSASSHSSSSKES